MERRGTSGSTPERRRCSGRGGSSRRSRRRGDTEKAYKVLNGLAQFPQEDRTGVLTRLDKIGSEERRVGKEC